MSDDNVEISDEYNSDVEFEEFMTDIITTIEIIQQRVQDVASSLQKLTKLLASNVI